MEIPAHEIGNLLHRIVYRFYAEPPDANVTDHEGNVDVAFLQRRQQKDQWIQESKQRLSQIIREEFGEGNDFCKKVTYKIEEDPKSVLNRFRNSWNPRIAVTVDMRKASGSREHRRRRRSR